MERFLERHRDRILGVLSGFDRVLFRGTLKSISYVSGLEIFLSSQHVLHKNFGVYVEKLSARLKEHAKAVAQKHARPYIYLESSATDKDKLVQTIQQRDGVRAGLICVLACVEPCRTFALKKNRQTQHLELVAAERKCLHLYFYYLDREFGPVHVRLQSWLPFAIQVCLNGREYLARQMKRLGISYEQRDNCFTRISDLPAAQALLERLVERKWTPFLKSLARRVNPWSDPKSDLKLRDYYWTIRQVEYATDVMFHDSARLAELYPALILHAIQHFGCTDVLRFLGRKTSARFNGAVRSDWQQRSEGVRIKHWVEENSIKMYDKEQSVLRIETTINNPRRFLVRRRATRKGRPYMRWLPMRKGLADTRRRAEIMRAANERYLQALAVVGVPAPTRQVLDPISERVIKDGRPYRALRPLSPQEAAVFQVVLNGAFHMQGFRNRDVRRCLEPARKPDSVQQRRLTGRATRWLRLLRAHGLIRKVSHTRYYRVTNKGQHVMSTALKLREVDIALIAA
jgi:hypothetical protein